MSASTPITIRCDCGKEYRVLGSPARERQRHILDYAICPHCFVPRLPLVWKPGDRENRCISCNVPFRVVHRMGLDRCDACYAVHRRLTLKTSLVILISNAGDQPNREGD